MLGLPSFVAVNVILTLAGIQAEHIRIMLRIRAEAVLPAIAETAVRGLGAGRKKIFAASEHTAVVLVFAKGVDHLIKLLLKSVRLQICAVVIPACEELLSGAAEISTQMADAARLHD